MGMNIELSSLLEYTEWERAQWRQTLQQHGEHTLQISAGPGGDGRMETVGDVVKHIFSAEKRYIERMSGRPLTDPATIPSNDLQALFRFGEQSRRELREFVARFPEQDWDKPLEFKMMNSTLRASTRKIVIHIVTHEMRHWAQIATLLRLNGVKGDFHDFLFSPVLGGELRRGEAKG